jgi:chromate transport protein ChrA
LPPRASPNAREIFLTFARIGASGFGGVNFWIRRVIIQEKRYHPRVGERCFSL